MNEITIKNQKFGVENEMTGITRRKAADALANLFGTTTVHVGGGYDEYQVRDSEGKIWALRSDSSITTERRSGKQRENTYNNDYAVEMVTPVLTYDEMDKLQQVIRALRGAGAIVNKSCGMHVHIDAANHNRNSLKNLLGIMYSKEDLLFKTLQVNDIRSHRWCKKVREPLLIKARKLSTDETKNLTRLEDLWYEGFEYASRNSHYNDSRYYALNLHSVFTKGTVEFRCFNATAHAGRIRAYVNLCLAISAQAISQRSTVFKKTQSNNPKFTFRTWLLRLGLNGEEFKNTRMHLLANLDGDIAWRYDRDKYEKKPKKKAQQRGR